ncbi:phosphohexomutase domain-containing protein [Vibrio cholerae]|uniref:phosphomannomutase CpsG n=1 Tax=Vibrio cholerae TaxID=666 RepID=UPI00226FD872|nr:phosphomannomutase CpsG [Vibrio cholerae]MCX9574651.1 phosphomannomutase CpsG [Vibrio cholerae]
MQKLTCFKAYDIRGQLGTELDNNISYRIGRAYGQFLKSENDADKTVVVGGDVRLTSEALKQALANGLMDAGINVIDIGVTGTEEIYFATFYLGVDGGIEVTASHNPMDYNGMKLVREGSKPISGDTGLREIQALAEKNEFMDVEVKGNYKKVSLLPEYVDHLISYITPAKIKPMKLVINSGNGAAGHVIDELEKRFIELSIPLEIIKVHHEEDGNFPNGIPNPLLPECRADTANAVKEHKADMGIAFDGDFDRCFLFDENGDFIEGYYIVGLLAEAFLQKEQGAKIIHDPRLSWNTIDVVTKSGGVPVMSKTGHAFIKERMRKEDAIYGGEMSAHHYFRDFGYCDSGMIPWLLITELLSLAPDISLSKLISAKRFLFPCSGEINFKVKQAKLIMEQVYLHYYENSIHFSAIDGISLEFEGWRFNLRDSNTEPLLRLNVESKQNIALMNDKVEELTKLIKKLDI